jgi:hypothetical protein
MRSDSSSLRSGPDLIARPRDHFVHRKCFSQFDRGCDRVRTTREHADRERDRRRREHLRSQCRGQGVHLPRPAGGRSLMHCYR